MVETGPHPAPEGCRLLTLEELRQWDDVGGNAVVKASSNRFGAGGRPKLNPDYDPLDVPRIYQPSEILYLSVRTPTNLVAKLASEVPDALPLFINNEARATTRGI
jgi:hypothetical protein